MTPEIKRYLDENGATYTPEALRKGLLDAGYEAGAVDAALREWQAARTGGGSNGDDRRTFGRWAVWLHLAALAATFLLLVVLKGTGAIGSILLGAAVLAIALLIGWFISSTIGRALVPGAGTTIALIVPAISAIALGGACFALMNSAITAPPRDGTVDLEILAPVTFDGSGAAACYVSGGDGSVQVLSDDLGMLDGRSIRLRISWYPEGEAGIPKPAGGTDLSITLDEESPQGRYYSTIPTTQLMVEAAPDGLSGTVEFEGLAREPESPEDTDLELSGSATWTCE